MRPADTIVAPATPPSTAARAIVRTSGGRAFPSLAALAGGAAPPHASATEHELELADGIVVPATVYAFRGPRSATGEDVVEYHLPGSPLFVRLLIARLLALGGRVAEPGEFTARAFFHGKLDLARAEGVAATIAAANRRELDAARRLLAGALAQSIAPIVDAAVQLLARVELDVDFADEAADALPAAQLAAALDAIDSSLAALADRAPRLERMAHEPRIVLAGKPNAGKSTLLNALAGSDRVVVSDVAGTTRDAVSARVALRRGVVAIVDTAGLDANQGPDEIARQMAEIARDETARADVLVRVVAIDEPEPDWTIDRAPDLIVRTKLDRAPRDHVGLAISAATGQGIERLRDALDDAAFGSEAELGGVALNARHVAAIGSARAALADARHAIDDGPEFVAASLRATIDALGAVTGTITPDDVLGRIFGGFCIGK